MSATIERKAEMWDYILPWLKQTLTKEQLETLSVIVNKEARELLAYLASNKENSKMTVVSPSTGVCGFCGKEKIVQSNGYETSCFYDQQCDFNTPGYNSDIPYEEGVHQFSVCYDCLVGGKSGQFDEWTDNEKILFWNTGSTSKEVENIK